MTSRRAAIIEDGAKEQLQSCGYTVTIVPPGYCRQYPAVHLIAVRLHETRLIRIRKNSHRPACTDSLMLDHAGDISWFRQYLAGHPRSAGLRCELWVYMLTYGFRCFEILPETIRGIEKPLPRTAHSAAIRGGP